MTASDTSESVAGHTYVRQMASVAGSEGEETEDGMQTQTDDEDGTQMQTDDDDGTQTQTEDGDDDGTQTPAGPETEHAGEEPSSPLTPLPDASSPLSPLSDASFPSPPPLPPPVAPLPPPSEARRSRPLSSWSSPRRRRPSRKLPPVWTSTNKTGSNYPARTTTASREASLTEVGYT